MRALLIMVAAPALLAQEAPPVFRTEAALVRVDVQVIDKGKPLRGLTAEDFVIYDENVPRPAAIFGRESEPLEVMFLLDVSGSMGNILKRMGDAAEKALEALRPNDRVGVMLFSRRAGLSLEPTDDRAAAVRAIRGAPLETELGAGTAINQAILVAAAYFRERPWEGRRALVVLTDNGGLSENAPDESVVRALADAEVVLNAIVTSNAKPPEKPPRGVEVNDNYTPANVFFLAEKSGGEIFRAGDAEKLREVLERIRSRYGLAYRAPASEPGGWREIRVELSPRARATYPKAVVRARSGYLSSVD